MNAFSGKRDSAEYTLASFPASAIDEKAWNDAVEKLNGCFIHSFAWSRYMAPELGQEPRYLVIKRNEETAACGWYAISGDSRERQLGIGRFEMESLPCFDPDKITAERVLREVSSLALRERCVSLAFGNSSAEYLGSDKKISMNRKIEFSVDLRKSAAELHADLHGRHRARIRKAAKCGLRIACFHNQEALSLLDALHALFEYTFLKQVTTGKERSRIDSSSLRRLITELVLTGNGQIFVAFSENAPVSCYISAVFGRQAQLLMAASNAQGYELNASFLVMWRMIEHFKERGFLLLNIGAVPGNAEETTDINHGLYRYKAGFCKEAKSLCSGTMILKPNMHAFLNFAKRVKSRAREITDFFMNDQNKAMPYPR